MQEQGRSPSNDPLTGLRYGRRTGNGTTNHGGAMARRRRGHGRVDPVTGLVHDPRGAGVRVAEAGQGVEASDLPRKLGPLPGGALAAVGMLNPLFAFIHVSSELAFILNSARLLPTAHLRSSAAASPPAGCG